LSKRGRTFAGLLAAGILSTGCALHSVLDPPEPVLIEADWVLHEVDGGSLLLSTPPGFTATNDTGCFAGHVQDSLPYGPGWRDFCVWNHTPGETIPVFTEGTDPACHADCFVFDDVSTTQMTLGRQDVIVQTAFVSGGFAGKVRAPEMLIAIPVPRGLVLLRAHYGDEADAAVILGIAQTISTRDGRAHVDSAPRTDHDPSVPGAPFPAGDP
jgi:hypothetical protein